MAATAMTVSPVAAMVDAAGAAHDSTDGRVSFEMPSPHRRSLIFSFVGRPRQGLARVCNHGQEIGGGESPMG
jgi:hypothetical protein